MKSLKEKIGYRPTWAEVDLNALEYNFNQVKKAVSPGTRILATIKADAYGHGLIPVARKLARCGADYFGVASIDEGIKLRKSGINTPVLILGLILKEDIPAVLKNKLIPTVCSYDQASEFDRLGRKLGRKVLLHIKVDTGMGRIGVDHVEAFDLIRKIHRLKFAGIEGIFTHFAFADMDRDFTSRQITLFNRLIARLKDNGINIPLVHSANSMGVLAYRNSHFNMVRPGLVLYGLYPAEKLRVRLKPVLSLKTRVVYIKSVPRGTGISYGHIYSTKSKTAVITLPIGYGDGYPRNLSNIAPLLIKGERFKICGRICMDQIMADVGDFKVRLGDEVVLIGSQGRNRITSEELAGLSGTISYEIVCGLGSRIPRVYIGR